MRASEYSKSLLTQMRRDCLAARYRLALTPGIRQVEILSLRPTDGDPYAGTLRFQQTIQRIGKPLHTQGPKTDRSCRMLALSVSLVLPLKAAAEDLPW